MFFLAKEQEHIIPMLYPTRRDEYLLMLRSLGDFLEKEVLPEADLVDREKVFPIESIKKLFEQGFTAMSFPQEYGGLQLPFTVYVAAMELVAKACPSTALSLGIHGTVCEGVKLYGSSRQKEKYLKPLILGEMLGAFALTEPDSGSDAEAMKTRAVSSNGDYIIDGAKMFITNGGAADVYLVFAQSNNGISAFLVEKTQPGIAFGREIDKLGVRGSKLTEVYFKECRVPEENLLGVEGQGFEYAKHMLSGGRITIAAQSIGIAHMAYRRALHYALQRHAFKQPIASFQMIRQKLADMITEINAARLLTYSTAYMKDQNKKDFTCEAAQSKLLASKVALKACDEAIQVFGGYGYTDETNVHRHWRDARLMAIGEGTNEIMRLIISKYIIEAAKKEMDS